MCAPLGAVTGVPVRLRFSETQGPHAAACPESLTVSGSHLRAASREWNLPATFQLRLADPLAHIIRTWGLQGELRSLFPSAGRKKADF